MELGNEQQAGHRRPRRPAVTLRQELTLRMAAMARQPEIVAGAVHAQVVHPADRERHARCLELGSCHDCYEDVSVRLAATSDGDVVGTGRITLWSPVVGFMVEREAADNRTALVLGPHTAELSDVVALGTARDRAQIVGALTQLATEVVGAHGVDHLYVLGTSEQLDAIAAPSVATVVATASRVDLHAFCRRAS